MYFTATLPSIKEWMQPGNTMLYSLNESFRRDIFWKFIVFPRTQESQQHPQIDGLVEKLQNGHNMPFQSDEAITAIEGAFTGVGKIEVGTVPASLQNVSLLAGPYVAFTLRILDTSKLPRLESIQNCDVVEEELNCRIQTGILKKGKNTNNVFGLLTTRNQIYSLEACSQILAGFFAKGMITWLVYCTNFDDWKSYAGIP